MIYVEEPLGPNKDCYIPKVTDKFRVVKVLRSRFSWWKRAQNVCFKQFIVSLLYIKEKAYYTVL